MTTHSYKAAAALTLLLSSTAMAADAPKGYQLGDVLFKPSLTQAAEYNDNIYYQENGASSDWVSHTTPSVVAELKNTKHMLRASANTEKVVYMDDNNNNYSNYQGTVDGRYNFSGDFFVDGSLMARKLHSSRGDDQADPTASAVEALPYYEYRSGASVYRRFDKLTLRPRAGAVKYDFVDVNRRGGGVIDQNSRDRNEYFYGNHLGYDITKTATAFIDGENNRRSYRRGGAVGRDSDGGNYLAGVTYRPSKAILSELAGGWMRQDYENTLYRDISAFSASARFDWEIKEGTKWRSSLRRSIDEVTDTGASGAVRTDAYASLSQELVKDLTGTVGARYSIYDYTDGNGATGGLKDRRDDLYAGRLGLAYKYTDLVTLTGDYSYNNNTSNLKTSEYTSNVVMFGVKLGFIE